jgi:hypothetical protein
VVSDNVVLSALTRPQLLVVGIIAAGDLTLFVIAIFGSHLSDGVGIHNQKVCDHTIVKIAGTATYILNQADGVFLPILRIDVLRRMVVSKRLTLERRKRPRMENFFLSPHDPDNTVTPGLDRNAFIRSIQQLTGAGKRDLFAQKETLRRSGLPLSQPTGSKKPHKPNSYSNERIIPPSLAPVHSYFPEG